jgi:hypothetical protein
LFNPNNYNEISRSFNGLKKRVLDNNYLKKGKEELIIDFGH